MMGTGVTVPTSTHGNTPIKQTYGQRSVCELKHQSKINVLLMHFHMQNILGWIFLF